MIRKQEAAHKSTVDSKIIALQHEAETSKDKLEQSLFLKKIRCLLELEKSGTNVSNSALKNGTKKESLTMKAVSKNGFLATS